MNRGDKFGEYNENNYANRLCMGVDPDRKGLVMFEPDLVPGSDIQLMRRDLGFEYIDKKINLLRERIEGRRPVCALYIDCAGRAAAYSGFDKEEASEVQKQLGDIPLLGFYTGVEIGPVAGEPMALDWTGVLAIISEGDPEAASGMPAMPVPAAVAIEADELSDDELDARIHDSEERIEALRSESDYYAGLSDELASKNIKLDSHVTALNHRLRTKDQGFAILAKLHDIFEHPQSFEDLCRGTLKEINSGLNMDKAIVLTEKDGTFCPAYWSGFTEAEAFSLEHVSLPLDAAWMETGFLLGNRDNRGASDVQLIRNATRLPYFTCVTIREAGRVIGLLLAARMKEVMPFYPPLDEEDASTLVTIGAFLSATNQLNRQRLQLEELTSKSAHGNGKPARSTPAAGDAKQEATTDERADPVDSMDVDELRQHARNIDRELATLKQSTDYYGKLADELAGQNVKKDSTLSMVNNELRIKMQGFAILSELQSSLGTKQTLDELCPLTLKSINVTLSMDKSMVMFADKGVLRPVFWSGFSEMEVYDIEDLEMPMDEDWMNNGYLLANRRTGKDEVVVRAKNFIPIPYFVAVPIRQDDTTIGLLVSGRLKEVKPFYPPLEKQDVDTFAAISGFLSAIDQLNRQREHLQELNTTLEKKVKERTSDLSDALGKLEVKNRFIKKAFGRYMSDEVVDSILETPDGLNMGGQTLPVTIMFSDLRGFSAISESLNPEHVVELLNIYLEEMTRIIFKHSGTINELMGDGLLIVFGAPTVRDDDAARAVACAMEMQMAMEKVNSRITAKGFPELHMGIGINTGQVVAGNVGSDMRTKYAVVGSSVNMAARVESFTIGGQVLITQSTLDAIDAELTMAGEFSTNFKGIKEPVTMYDVTGIGGGFDLRLPERSIDYTELASPMQVKVELVEGKTSEGKRIAGSIMALADRYGMLDVKARLDKHSNLKIHLDSPKLPEDAHVYAKVMNACGKDGGKDCGKDCHEINFTYMSREVRIFLDQIRSEAATK